MTKIIYHGGKQYFLYKISNISDIKNSITGLKKKNKKLRYRYVKINEGRNKLFALYIRKWG